MPPDNPLERLALEYHRLPRPGKIAVVPTKPLANQRDLALAYSPGVAAACAAIQADPSEAASLTGRANLVAVVTNGTAVLGLGAIGPLAAKPVMEGKAVLFKKFAGIDVFDLEIAETDPDKLVDIVASLEPTFGAINLEDIRSPDCFAIEKKLRARMKIPVFHDDQHGTAIVAAAALLNGLAVVGKRIEGVKLVSTGGGAAGIACLDLLVELGLKPEHIVLVDHKGVVFRGRTEDMTEQKARYARDTEARALAEVMEGADVFLGLSAPNILSADMVKAMARNPLILALANPVPEIMPDVAKEARPDAVIATGRSDFPNQVNNVLCFPFIFRGALDVGATAINREMALAAAKAIMELARAEVTETVESAYVGEDMRFGPDFLIPKPLDSRLIVAIAPAVARAAMDSGVATRPIADFDAYREQLGRFVFRSGMLMKPVFERARQALKRVAYAEGEDERVLRAVQVVLDEKIAVPILIGRPEVVAKRIERLGLRFRPGSDCEIVNPESDPRFNDYWRLYHSLTERKGVSPDRARTRVRTNNTVIAALMLRRGEADAMLCGAGGRYVDHLHHIRHVIGQAPDARVMAALVPLILPHGTFFLTDTHVTAEPTAEEIAEIALLAAEEVRRFGVVPKVALLSHSSFGSRDTPSSLKVREAVRIISERAPGLEVEGEMNGDAAVNEELRKRIFPNSRLAGTANLLVMPNLDAANISFNLLKSLGEGLSVGPILLGTDRPAHIITSAVTARGLVNMTAFAAVDAQTRGRGDS
ncbi:MAG: NADP-dependent malic enzyme [Rhodospirillales bacterium]|nr:NADP-dependent malic enzyme [Acidimicrobiia bacterium]MBM3950549.1 NADP-dependent malic enzyme [Rhodospirillales bacterium]